MTLLTKEGEIFIVIFGRFFIMVENYTQTEVVLCASNSTDYDTCTPMIQNCTYLNGNTTECNVKLFYTDNNISAILKFFDTVIIVACIISFLGIPGNAVIIYSVVRNKSMHTRLNILLTYLAVIDLIYSFADIIGCIALLINLQLILDTAFRVIGFISFSTGLCSIWTLVIISYVRYRAVTNSLLHRNYENNRQMICIVLLLYVVALFLCSPLLNSFGFTNSTLHLEILKDKILIIAYFVIGFIVPFLFICIFYTMVFREIRLKKKQREQLTQQLVSHAKTNRFIIVTILAFVVCWLPFYVSMLFLAYADSLTVLYALKTMLVCSSLTNLHGCINPFIYGFMSKNFRIALKKTLCARRYRQEEQNRIQVSYLESSLN